MNIEERVETINPLYYNGRLTSNTSKSYLQRALALSLLADGPTNLDVHSWSEDSLKVKNVIQQLGAKVKIDNCGTWIYPDNKLCPEELNFGESGLAFRMFASIVSLWPLPITLNGAGSLQNRPIKPIVDTLAKAGIRVSSLGETLPITISSPISQREINVDGRFSSQILSGLLITAPLLDQDTVIHVENPTSIPYIDLTLDIMSAFGIDVEHKNHEEFMVHGNQSYHCPFYSVEGDWSGMANHVVGAALSGKVIIDGLQEDSKQGDKAIVEVVHEVGAKIEFNGDQLIVKKDKLLPFSFDATHCPDLFPPLVVLALGCSGTSKIKGVNRLIHKESNRLQALIEMFGKLGAILTVEGSHLVINGGQNLHGGTVESFNDHRMAMAAAIAATISDSAIEINNCEAVTKSYPDFFCDLARITAEIN